MRFVSRTSPAADRHGPAYWFIFQGDRLLVKSDGRRASAPLADDVAQLGFVPLRSHYLGYLPEAPGAEAGPRHCYCA